MASPKQYSEMKNYPAAPIRITITAGPTEEPLDPVRYISNFSTGTMGYAIAAECSARGFEVCLITGPVRMSPPPGVETVNVTTACEMKEAVEKKVAGRDCLIMTAAVCDFRPAKAEDRKIKKSDTLTIRLKKNPDILTEIGRIEGLTKIGFALETDNALENAGKKLRDKGLDMIVVNTKTWEKDPFGPGEKDFTIVNFRGDIRKVEKVTKDRMACILMDEAEKLINEKRTV